jgi:hypothetical protein
MGEPHTREDSTLDPTRQGQWHRASRRSRYSYHKNTGSQACQLFGKAPAQGVDRSPSGRGCRIPVQVQGQDLAQREPGSILFSNQAREIPIVMLTVPVAPSMSQSFTRSCVRRVSPGFKKMNRTSLPGPVAKTSPAIVVRLLSELRRP